MTYKGHVKNGVVVLDDAVQLPEGAVVEVSLRAAVPPADSRSSVWEKLLQMAGSVEGLPADIARQHDHYLYGTPRQ